METIIKTKFAVLFKHTRGWTHVEMFNTVAQAQIFVRDHRLKNMFKWKILPCKIHYRLSDEMAKGFS